MKYLINNTKMLFFSVILFVNAGNLYAQTFKATYLITYQKDSTNDNRKREERAFLFTDRDQKSYYATQNFIKKDSISRLISEGKASAYEIMSDKSNLSPTEFQQFIIKDPQKDITIYEKINRDTYRYDITNTLSWKISDSTAKINGYDCLKATTHFAGRNYEAWFTKEIPVSDGPYIFRGLPGLVVKINDVKSYYNFELIGFESFKEEVVTSISKDPEKIILTDRESVFKIREEKRLDPIGSFDRSFGAVTRVTPEDREYMRKRVAANNNPLELSID